MPRTRAQRGTHSSVRPGAPTDSLARYLATRSAWPTLPWRRWEIGWGCSRIWPATDPAPAVNWSRAPAPRNAMFEWLGAMANGSTWSTSHTRTVHVASEHVRCWPRKRGLKELKQFWSRHISRRSPSGACQSRQSSVESRVPGSSAASRRSNGSRKGLRGAVQAIPKCPPEAPQVDGRAHAVTTQALEHFAIPLFRSPNALARLRTFGFEPPDSFPKKVAALPGTIERERRNRHIVIRYKRLPATIDDIAQARGDSLLRRSSLG